MNNDCDHIIGIEKHGEAYWNVTVYNQSNIGVFAERYDASTFVKYSYCPLCGEKIDWKDALEEWRNKWLVECAMID